MEILKEQHSKEIERTKSVTDGQIDVLKKQI